MKITAPGGGVGPFDLTPPAEPMKVIGMSAPRIQPLRRLACVLFWQVLPGPRRH